MPLSKAGESVKCPDCHSINVVPGLKQEPAENKSKGPTLEGTEDFGMSEVVDRPKYRPLQSPQGEYQVLSAMDPASMEYRLTVPGEQPKARSPSRRGWNPTTMKLPQARLSLLRPSNG